MRSRFYFRDGSPADADAWRAKQGEASYVQVDKTSLPSGKWVSTLWLGVDDGAVTSVAGQPPLIFETVVFDESTRQAVDRERYATEAQAQDGHRRMVAKWSAR